MIFFCYIIQTVELKKRSLKKLTTWSINTNHLVYGKMFNYIHNINGNIDKWINNSDKIKLIDCYDIEEIGSNIDEIICQYQKILNTSGEKETDYIRKM